MKLKKALSTVEEEFGKRTGQFTRSQSKLEATEAALTQVQASNSQLRRLAGTSVSRKRASSTSKSPAGNKRKKL